MSRAHLVFRLPAETPEFLAAAHAGQLVSAIDQVRLVLRAKLKHMPLSDDARRELEDVQATLLEWTSGLPDEVLG